MTKKTILVAPLNWGLGHATRCVPIINALLNANFKVVLASDGLAFQFLTNEFPSLTIFELAKLDVQYAKTKYGQGFNMLKQIPKLYRFLAEDQSAIRHIAEQIEVNGIISDNRPGVYLKSIPSVYINHQLNVKSGFTSQLSSRLHQQQMKNFNEIWVPDEENDPSLSGELGHFTLKDDRFKIQYLGWLSRLKPTTNEFYYDYCAVISGPEPQRSLFEKMVEDLFLKLPGKKILISGSLSFVDQKIGFERRNMLNTTELNEIMDKSKKIICRSGYTSLMDLLRLQKPALLVPTPGQFEQEYLAKRMQKLGWFLVCKQADFEQKAAAILQNIPFNKLPDFKEKEIDFSIFLK